MCEPYLVYRDIASSCVLEALCLGNTPGADRSNELCQREINESFTEMLLTPVGMTVLKQPRESSHRELLLLTFSSESVLLLLRGGEESRAHPARYTISIPAVLLCILTASFRPKTVQYHLQLREAPVHSGALSWILEWKDMYEWECFWLACGYRESTFVYCWNNIANIPW